MTHILYIALEYFFVYSFLGWCVEVVFQAVAKGLIVNRGFLNGPVCPIYGVGVIAIFRVLEAVGDRGLHEQNALMVFLFGFALATLVELIGGWMLDKLFHARWWDYSSRPFNFHGYVCLEFSIIWGLGILLVVRGINPSVSSGLHLVPENIGWIFIGIFSVLFIADLIISIMVMAGLNKSMAEIDEMREKMRVVSNELSEHLGTRALDTAQHIEEGKVQAALARAEAKDRLEVVKAEAQDKASLAKADADARLLNIDEKRRDLVRRIEKSRHFGAGRLLRAFPDMKHRQHHELLETIKEELRTRA